jgi:FtsP/CotA-like multicopper oxidase with cupredoxin domain
VALPTRFAPARDVSHARIAKRRTVVFSEDTTAGTFFINDKMFDENRVDIRPGSTRRGVGRRNDSAEEHSFQLYVNDFQLMSTNSQPQRLYGQQDIASITASGPIVIRIHFKDYTGKTVLHCHIFNQEEAGMVAVRQIVK